MDFRFKQVVGGGIAFGVFATILGVLLYYAWSFIYNDYVLLYAYPAFRFFDDPQAVYLYILPFLEGLIFAFFYGSVRKAISCNTPFERGTTYGLFLFLVSSLPLVIFIYSMFQVQLFLMAFWLVELLIRNYIGGGIIASVYEKLK